MEQTTTTHDSFFQIISTLLKPLIFASKDNFAHLAAVKDIEPLAQNLCRQAIALPIPENNVKNIKELQNMFEGFDSLALEGKRERIKRAMEIIKEIEACPRMHLPGVRSLPLKALIKGQKPAPECIYGGAEVRSQSSIEEIKDKLSRLLMSITQVKGIGPKLGAIFKKKGLETVEDVLYWLPIRYEDRRQIKKISLLRIGTKEVASGEIMAMGEVFYGRRKVFEISMGDGSGFLRLKWFHYRLPLIKKRYKIGQRLVVYGEIGSFGGQKEIIHPDVEIFEKGEEVDSINFNAIVPVYSQIGNMHQKTLRKIIRNIVDDYSSLSVGSVPSDIQKRYGLLELPAAMSEVHTPSKIPSCPSLEKGGRRDLNSRDWLPKKSLVFDELFCLEIGLALKKRSVCREDGIAFKVGVNFKSAAMVEKLLSMLPFKLTAAQERVVSEIKMDMSEPHPMNRLIQGDVGSGKTVVAFIASLIAIENNYQSAIMAPTEILAEQHYLNIHRYADVLGIKIALLTSSFAKSEKMGILNHIKAGEADLVIGTHALIQEDVEFKKLGLVIVDEQHRFGVVQRALLKNKGARGKPACAWPHSDRGQGTEKELTPDVLVMTATPIPRTLAMTVFGDLDVSVIDELPPGRRPIKTKVFREKEREQVYKIIRGELVKGRQSYIVYPLIEESEELDLRDATKMAEHMKKDIFSEYNIGLLHGRMKPDEKEAVMKAFKAKEINILVSTTVIEVGIDVPNASVMVIEHAERFGLSQLHQLRGRVGRGGYDSFCILLAGRVGSEDTYKRLKVMENTNDGFKIAEEDLNIRGPGDFLGTRQSGLPDFRIANLLTDASILQKARDEAFNLLRNDPDLIKQEHNALKQIVKVRWNGKMELSQIG